MVQSSATPPIVAREVLWKYRGVSEEPAEKDFFTALDKAVAAEIARRSLADGRIWVGREIHLRVGPYPIQARLTNVEPLLATTVSDATRTLAQYREKNREEGQDVSTFLAEVIRYPDDAFDTMFDALVGLDETKEDLFRKLTLLISPQYIDTWVAHFYAPDPPRMLRQALRDRYPLIILEGEVGSGKTALARSIGQRLASRLGTDLALFIMNAQVRGGGHVGELTQNISLAFAEAERCQEREQIPILLLIDEADALAQARGGNQTHHEDDAGVNTLIQRIDRLRGRPMAVIFATNLVHSLDPAIVRRAVSAYHFDRPSAQQRATLFRTLLVDARLNEHDIAQLVSLTEPRQLPGYGVLQHRYTYSDLAQRVIPHAVEEAVYAQRPLSLDHLAAACRTIRPTPERQGASATLKEDQVEHL